MATAAAALQSVITNGVAASSAQPATGTGATAPSATAGGVLNAGVILVVDDNAANREMLGRRLEREGHQVQLAAGGREALELLRERRVDLVLLDVMMPEVDGYAVLQQLKTDVALRDIPVLMISALDEVESVVRCIELGAEDYLPKPFDPVLLRARIGACWRRSACATAKRSTSRSWPIGAARWSSASRSRSRWSSAWAGSSASSPRSSPS